MPVAAFQFSVGFDQQFCRTCGCLRFGYDDDETTLFYLHVTTFDGGKDPGHRKEIESHEHKLSKVEWVHVSDAIPQFETDDPRGIIIDTVENKKLKSQISVTGVGMSKKTILVLEGASYPR